MEGGRRLNLLRIEFGSSCSPGRRGPIRVRANALQHKLRAPQKPPEVEREGVVDGRENELCKQRRGNGARKQDTSQARRGRAQRRRRHAEAPAVRPVDASDVHLSARWQAGTAVQKA
jgi:hypothetical protein